MNEKCPEPGQLRAWLDGEVVPGADGRLATSAAPTLIEHLARCDICPQTLGALSADAEIAATVLGGMAERPPTTYETEQALAHVRERLAVSPSRPTDLPAAWPADRDAAAGRAADRTGRPADDLRATPLLAVVPRAVAPTAGGQNAAGAARADTASRRFPMSMPMSLTLVWQRWRLPLAGLAAALALVLALATPDGRTAAAAFLAQFRSQRLQIVTFNPDQLRQRDLFRLDRIATVRTGQNVRSLELASVQEAASRAGFQVLEPDPATLPTGVSRTPKVRFQPTAETRVTFDRQKTRDYLDSMNRKDLALPEKMHGATLVVSLPPIVMLEYAASDGKPGVMIGEAREVQVGVEGGASLDEVRSFLLSLPGLPPDVVRQLQSIKDWRTTLPVPVPVDSAAWQETTVGGAQAFIINDNSGLGSGVIWQRDGRILGVAGPLKATDVRRVAESLR